MSNNAVAIALVAVVAFGAFVFYSQQQAQREAIARASTPAGQIGGGVGALVSGIVSLATASGGTTR